MPRRSIIAKWTFVANQRQNKFVKHVCNTRRPVNCQLDFDRVSKIKIKVAVRRLVPEFFPSNDLFVGDSHAKQFGCFADLVGAREITE